jgi:PAXNEB protein
LSSFFFCTADAQAISHGQHLVIPIDTFESDDTDGKSSSSSSSSYDHWNEINDNNNGVIVNSQLSEVESLLDSLPRNLHWDRQQQKADAAAAAAANNADVAGDQQQLHLDTLHEEEDDDNGNDEDDHEAEQGLKIAWQYRKSVQREMLGHDHASSSSSRSKSGGGGEDIFCHSFDLQGRLNDQVCVNNAVDILLPATRPSPSCGFAFYRQIQAKLQDMLLLQSSQPRQVVRLLFHHSNPCMLQIALPLTLAYIRHYQLPVVVMIATCPWKHQQTLSSAAAAAAMRLLRRMVDVVLETEGFASRSGDFYPPPPEFRNFQGLLRVVKMSTVTAATAVSSSPGSGGSSTASCGGGGAGGHFADRTIHKGPAADLYGLKRDRRKLHIQLLHIPPEDYAHGGGSVGGGGVRSGAGRVGTYGSGAGGGGCGSSGGGPSLDF